MAKEVTTNKNQQRANVYPVTLFPYDHHHPSFPPPRPPPPPPTIPLSPDAFFIHESQSLYPVHEFMTIKKTIGGLWCATKQKLTES